MLSFEVLQVKVASKLQDHFNPAKTTIRDLVDNVRIQDDDDLWAGVVLQLIHKRLDAVHLVLREPEGPKRKSPGGRNGRTRATRRSAQEVSSSSEGVVSDSSSGSDDDQPSPPKKRCRSCTAKSQPFRTTRANRVTSNKGTKSQKAELQVNEDESSGNEDDADIKTTPVMEEE
jgi:hypothetical protein